MQDWKRYGFAYWAVVGILFATLGCAKSRMPERKAVVPVRGTMMSKGKPLEGAVVSLHPLTDANPRALRSHGRVGADGTFSLTTYDTADGAPQGEYIVTVYWADASKRPRDEDEEEGDLPPDLLKGRFATRQVSRLRARIGNEPIQFAPTDLGSEEVTKAREFYLREK